MQITVTLKDLGIESLRDTVRQVVEKKDWLLAQHACETLLSAHPDDFYGLQIYPLSLAEQGQFRAAEPLYRQALKALPNTAMLWTNYSVCLGALGLRQEAFEAAKKAFELNTSDHRCRINFLAAALNSKKYPAAIQVGEDILKEPLPLLLENYAKNNLATAYRSTGELHRAIDLFRQVIESQPELLDTHTNLLLTMHSAPEVSDLDLLDAAKRFSMEVQKKYQYIGDFSPQVVRDPHKRLKIGFLSPDFNRHPVIYFFEGLITKLDRAVFFVECFYLKHQLDDATERIRCYSDEFFTIADRSVEDQVSFIRERNLDILIDLAGHTADNGLSIMAKRCAPVQATWLGFPGTTGLNNMDWRITDKVASPPGDERHYTERLARLPQIFCAYRPLARGVPLRFSPEYQVAQAPAIKNKFITFGVCNNLAKITDQSLRCWADILANVKNSRLLIEAPNLNDEAECDRLRDRLRRCGVDLKILILVEREAKNQYLTYHRIDVALDTFPLTGGTTTFDTLWMGVPLVTMAGTGFRSRMSASILSALGCNDWIAQNSDEYVAIAIKLSGDIQQLNRMRLQIRPKMESSPLMDEHGFARIFGQMLRDFWWHWLVEQDFDVNISPQDKILFYQKKFHEWRKNQIKINRCERVYLGIKQSIDFETAHARLRTLLNESDLPIHEKLNDRKIEGLVFSILATNPMDAICANLVTARYAHSKQSN